METIHEQAFNFFNTSELSYKVNGFDSISEQRDRLRRHLDKPLKSQARYRNILETVQKAGLIADRKHHLHSYNQCFVGREFVDWLVSTGQCSTRDEAVELGRAMRKAGAIRHVSADKDFEDKKHLYRICPDYMEAQSTLNSPASASSIEMTFPWNQELSSKDSRQQTSSQSRIQPRTRSDIAISAPFLTYHDRNTTDLLLDGTYLLQPSISATHTKAISVDSGPQGKSHSFYGVRNSSIDDLKAPRMVELSIPRATIEYDNDGQKFVSFEILVELSLCQWTLRRRYREFLALHDALAGCVPHDKLPALPTKKSLGGSMDPAIIDERRKGLEIYLRTLVFVQEAWLCSALIAFLDNASSSLRLQIEFGRVVDHVASLERVCRETQEELRRSRECVDRQEVILSQLMERMNPNDRNSFSAHAAVAPVSVIPPSTIPTKRGKVVSSEWGAGGGTSWISQDVFNSSGARYDSDKSDHGDAPLEIFNVRSIFDGNDTNDSNDIEESRNPWENTKGIFLSSNSSSGIHISIPQNAKIPVNQQPTNADKRIAKLIEVLHPHPNAENHRNKVFKYISNLIKKALGAQAFAVECYAIRTYLPDDDITISAFLCQGQEQTWFIKVSEALCMASTKVSSDESKIATQGPPGFTSTGTEEFPIVKNVIFANSGTKSIRCIVGNVPVEITANELQKLCIAAFLEEVDRIVGREHLFKRSILLIRAWCVYESRIYSGNRVLSSLSNYAIEVLILHLFHYYHSQIFHPLQALALFFSIYSSFDWEKNCCSIEGPRSLNSICTAPEPPPNRSYLIRQEVLNSYRRRYQRISEEDEMANDHIAQNIAKFQVRSFNIMDPLDPQRNLCDGISRPLSLKIHQILQRGYRSFSLILSAMEKEQRTSIDSSSIVQSSSISQLDMFFANSWQRFGSGWRPDSMTRVYPSETENPVLSNAVSSSLCPGYGTDIGGNTNGCDYLAVDFDSVCNHLKYCAFLLDSEVSAPALLALASEILLDRGPLPVGEIGKLLQEATANPSLSATLKEKFGGLKKFLEKYPDDFLVSADHPFNPKVFLRSSLNEEEISSILNGIPIGLNAGARKKKTSKKKKISLPSESDNGCVVPLHGKPCAISENQTTRELSTEAPEFIPSSNRILSPS